MRNLGENTSRISRQVTETVAEKILQNADEQVYSVDPFKLSFIKTPGIYNVKPDGKMFQICEFDTSQQIAISNMRTEVIDEKTEIIEDSIERINVRVNILGSAIERPYRKIKVSGYKVKRVLSGDSSRSAEWIINNVASGCSGKVLPKNKPYFVATAVATAYNVETVSGGGFGKASFAFGPTDFEFEIEDEPSRRVQNKIFAVAGRLYK